MTIEPKKLIESRKKIRPYESKCEKGGHHWWQETNPGTDIYECTKKCNSVFINRLLISPN